MIHEDFTKLLKKAKINKKEFASMTKLAYSTVGNWSSTNSVPDWAESWLKNYIKSKDMDKVIETVKPYVEED